uniref:Secreted protein n=1 Tax=Denticeps clupeoides TaxID=299321 RepID=A0AAY4AL18_9TELE
MSRNRRITLVFAGFVTAVAAYKLTQKINRAGIHQEDVQACRYCFCSFICHVFRSKPASYSFFFFFFFFF